ncbi:MAG: lipoprotein insertase outer membrane protein LolB [Oryzomonas sp.]|uniref:lipoprotein insertase outer membrane protein LolB n=1 Tax=Oryzomonas sp. TaxID=2855186 RepID=UPI00283C60D2|nr:lipoprotein insertase outer membrane protein LolB [Oryzomonas sp.]MDR3578810.1 lipoprotein insertase outer membrane protein LolB [Oryzomonas sp.]
MKRYLSFLFLLTALSLVAGCAAFTPKPPLEYRTGAQVDTLSAAVSLSITKGEQGMGANGLLLYRRPDRMRVVILSPFGTTMMETVLAGEQVTVVDNSKGVAFSGLLADLPEQGEGDTWRQARWVMDVPAPGSSLRDGSMERVNSTGLKERVTFENGLVVAKSLSNGDEAHYNDYEVVNGTPLATEIIMYSHNGMRLRIKINDPEVNTDLSPEAFTPHLDSLTLYPLSALQGRQ